MYAPRHVDLPTPINHPRKNQNENDVKNEDAVKEEEEEE
jgi:hypothetical protein